MITTEANTVNQILISVLQRSPKYLAPEVVSSGPGLSPVFGPSNPKVCTFGHLFYYKYFLFITFFQTLEKSLQVSQNHTVGPFANFFSAKNPGKMIASFLEQYKRVVCIFSRLLLFLLQVDIWSLGMVLFNLIMVGTVYNSRLL